MSDRSERQSARIKAILRDLQQGGSVSIEDLCERYSASLATIRRDLQELEDRGLLRRVRGGAMPLEPLFYEPFRTGPFLQDLVGRQAEEKRRIGQAAAELLEPGNTLSLTAGTTTTEVVRCLPYEYNLKVITNTSECRDGAFKTQGRGGLRDRRPSARRLVLAGGAGSHRYAAPGVRRCRLSSARTVLMRRPG